MKCVLTLCDRKPSSKIRSTLAVFSPSIPLVLLSINVLVMSSMCANVVFRVSYLIVVVVRCPFLLSLVCLPFIFLFSFFVFFSLSCYVFPLQYILYFFTPHTYS